MSDSYLSIGSVMIIFSYVLVTITNQLDGFSNDIVAKVGRDGGVGAKSKPTESRNRERKLLGDLRAVGWEIRNH